SRSRGTEALGPDACWIMAEVDEPARRCLNKWSWAADVRERFLAPGPGDLLEELPIDPAGVAVPALGLLAGQRKANVDVVVVGELHQLVTVDDVVEGARRVEQPYGHGAP